MTPDDLPLGLTLTQRAGWNQTPHDWQRFLKLAPTGCFVACINNQPRGTAVAFQFNNVGWIAMILVHPDARGQGLGTALTTHALTHLQNNHATTIRLDATPAGQPIYESLGFTADYQLHRYEGTTPATPTATPTATLNNEPTTNIRDAHTNDLDAICALDTEITATDRRPLLQALHREPTTRWLIAHTDDQLQAYATLRPGRRAHQLGPAAARQPAHARTLANQLIASIAGQRLFIDIPQPNTHATNWAQQHNLTIQRPLLRMTKGQPLNDNPAQLWASSGPEKG